MEGMTFKQSPYGKIRALYRTKTGNGDIRISGACWRKTTAMLKMRRYRYLIEPDQQEKDFFKHVLLLCPLPFYPDGPFFQTRSAEAIVF